MKKLISALMASAVVLAASGGVAHAAVGQMVDIDIQGNSYSGSGKLTNGHDQFITHVSGTNETVGTIVFESSGGIGFGTFNYTADSSSAISDLGSSTMAGTTFKNLYDG